MNHILAILSLFVFSLVACTVPSGILPVSATTGGEEAEEVEEIEETEMVEEA